MNRRQQLLLLGKGSGSPPIPTPHANGWAAAVIANGSTYSANTLAALQALEVDLTLAGLLPKLIYLNPRCGNDITAARIPLISPNGYQLDTQITSTGGLSYSEATGLGNVSTGGGIMSYGVDPTTTAISATGATLGFYNLVNSSVSTRGAVGQFGTVASPNVNAAKFCLYPNNGSLLIFDNWAGAGTGRTQASATSTLTKGTIMGSRWDTLSAGVFLNGVLKGGGNGTQGAVNGALSTDPMAFYTGFAVSGMEWVGTNMTIEDAPNMGWAANTFNVSLGRGVTAEGLQ